MQSPNLCFALIIPKQVILCFYIVARDRKKTSLLNLPQYKEREIYEFESYKANRNRIKYGICKY